MKFCVSSRTAGRRSLAETFELAAELGYDGVEVWAADLDRTAERADRLRQQAERLGLTVLAHAYTKGANFAARKADRRRKALERTRRVLRLAAELGAPLCVVHPGKMKSPDDRAEDYWPWLIEGYGRLADEAEKLDLLIGAEHMEPDRGHFFCGPADIRRLFSAVPSRHLGLTLDLAHASAWCAANQHDLTSFVEQADRLLHVHLSDASRERRHLPLGEGLLDVARLLDAVRARGYRGTVTIEGRARGREVAVITANWRSLGELARPTAAERPLGLLLDDPQRGCSSHASPVSTPGEQAPLRAR